MEQYETKFILRPNNLDKRSFNIKLTKYNFFSFTNKINLDKRSFRIEQYENLFQDQSNNLDKRSFNIKLTK